MGRGLIALLLFLLAGSLAAEPPAQEGPRLTGLKTRIETPRYDQTVTFYRDLLGLTVLDSWDDDGDRGTILGIGGSASGEAFLEVGFSDEPALATSVSLQFRVADMDDVVKRLRGRWEFRGPEQRPWGSSYLYLHDPAGTKVIVYQGEL